MGESKEEDVQASSVRSAASDPRRASGGGLVHPETVASQGGVSGEVRRGSVDADIPEGARERCEADRAAGRAAQKPTAERRNSVDADTPRDRDSNKKRAKLDLAEAERKEEEEKKPALHDAHATQVAKGQRKSRISRIAAMVITKTVGSGYKVAPRGEAELKRTRLIAEVNAVRRRLQTNNKYVMAPTDKSVRQWDIVTFLALLFTAVVTPAEVAFLDGNMDALWFVNRMTAPASPAESQTRRWSASGGRASSSSAPASRACAAARCCTAAATSTSWSWKARRASAAALGPWTASTAPRA